MSDKSQAEQAADSAAEASGAVTDLTEPDKYPVYRVGDQVVDAWGRKQEEIPDEDKEKVGEVDGDASPYEGWKKAELVQEAKNRNEGRRDEDKIDYSANDTAADLRAKLEDDDAAEE